MSATKEDPKLLLEERKVKALEKIGTCRCINIMV